MPLKQNIEFTMGQRHTVFARYPFLPLVLVLIVGIFVGEKFSISIPVVIVIVIIILLAIIAFIARKQTLSIIAVYLIIFLLGIKSIDMAIPAKPAIPSEKTVFMGVVYNTPRVRAKTTQAQIKVFAFRDSSKIRDVDGKMLIYFRTDSLARDLRYGDSVVFEVKAREVRNMGNPYEFDYKNFLRLKGIYYTGFVDSGNVRIIGYGGGNKIVLLATRLRDRLLKIYHFYGIKGKEYSVLAALTLGYRQALDRETLHSFSRSGAMHILAVSGLHVGILFGILMLLFGGVMKTRYRWGAFVVVLFVLWGFALMTGFSPSVRRSAFMFSLVSLSMVIHHKTNIYNSLAASAFFLLLFYPVDLFSVGFWLSYLAVVGIVSVYPLLNNLFYLPWPFNRLWSLVSVSIAAQVGTMPIGLYVFHQFPNYFLLTNLFAIPLAAIILYLAILLFVIARFTALATIVAKVLNFFVKILLKAINITENLPGATLSHVYITFGQMILIYTILICLLLMFVYKKRSYLIASLFGVLVFVGINFYNKIHLTIPPRVIVYNIPGHSVINFISPATNVLLTDTAVNTQIIERYMLPYWRYAHLPYPTHLYISDTVFYYGKELVVKGEIMKFINKKIFILESRNILENTTHKKLDIDYLMLGNNVYTDMREVSEFFNFRQIIFMSSCRQFRTKLWKKQADSIGLQVYDVITQGAFIQKINYYD